MIHYMCSHLQVPLNNSKLKTMCKNMLYVYMFMFIMKINIQMCLVLEQRKFIPRFHNFKLLNTNPNTFRS